MSGFASACFHAVQPFVDLGGARREETTRALRAARIPLFPEWYLSLALVVPAALGFLAAAATGVALAVQGALAFGVGFALSLGAGLATFFWVRLLFLVYPRVLASGRARAIDAEFPSVVMLCYALARGGLSAPEVFRVIAQERATYGEISREFDLVIRDVERLGQDVNSALLSVAATTPSATLKGFFEGLVTILNSGADPRDFFRRQAEIQLAEAELRIDKEVEQAGLLAESYVSGLLVLPLLLLVVLSVLSILGTVQTFFIPIIIFLIVPGGTLAYLVLVDMLLPPESTGVSLQRKKIAADAGVDLIRPELPILPRPGRTTRDELARELERRVARGGEDAAAARRALRVLPVAWVLRRIADRWREIQERSLAEPLAILWLSLPAALAAGIAGAVALALAEAEGSARLVYGTGVLLGATLIAIVPVMLFHEARVQRGRAIERALPGTLSKLAGFNERGVPLLRSFQILGRAGAGPLAREFRDLDRDVSWTANLTGALARMRERATTRRLRKVGILFERGVAATGNLKEVLEIAATESATSESQVTRKRQAMMSYAIVIYVVYAVFLYVVFTIADLFYGAEGFSALGGSGSVGVAGFGRGLSVETAHTMYLSAILVQGACCGLVAGKLSEGTALSGLKHLAIMCVLGWLVFYLGVFL